MGPAAIIGAIVSVAGGLMQKSAADKAAKQQRMLAEEAARNKRMEAEEMARRQAKEDRSVEGRARALAAASGLAGSGTQLDYIQELEKTNKQNVDWIRRSGDMQAGYTQQAGYNQAATTEAQGTAALLGGVSNAVGYWG